MKTLNAIIFAIACLILISSCKKDDEPKISKTELLAGKTSKSWKQTAGKENGSDYFSTWASCNKDDVYVFNANKNFELNEGASKCEPTHNQIADTGVWELKSNDSVLKITTASDIIEIEASILELTATTLRIRYTNQGDVYEETYTAQ
jgi:hypothetical protein